jgi:DNA-binding Lrp family transcriptional regulator
MHKLDEQERLIVRELIRDPRISDNQIAIKTNVPLKTVNRKRKILEEKGLIHYYCYLDNTFEGTSTFLGRQLYIVVLRDGVTRKDFSQKYGTSEKVFKFFTKHMLFSFLGEYGGNTALITLIESHSREDLTEIYNAEVVPELESYLGNGCIKKTITLPISSTLRMARNYFPKKNMSQGIIKEDWPNEFIFFD